METKDHSKPTTPMHGYPNHHHEDVIKVSSNFAQFTPMSLSIYHSASTENSSEMLYFVVFLFFFERFRRKFKCCL